MAAVTLNGRAPVGGRDPGVSVVGSRAEMAAMPVMRKLGEIKTANSIPGSMLFHPTGDVSNFARNTLHIPGGSAIGATIPIYAPIGALWARDNFKQMATYQRIGDREGAVLEARKGVENTTLSAGAFTILGEKTLGFFGGVSQLVFHTIPLSSIVTPIQSVLGWAGGLLFTAYYAIWSLRLVTVLINFAKGKSFRDELLQDENPVQAVEKKIEKELDTIRGWSTEQLEAVAIEEGSRWLKQVAKEAKNVTWDPNDPAFVRAFLKDHPEYLKSRMGETPQVGFKINELARFGQYIAKERMRAALWSNYGRLLGGDAIAAAQNGQVDQFRALLISPSWKREALKLGLVMTGLVATIAGLVLSGGTLLPLIVAFYGIGGIIWILLMDGQLFLKTWKSGEFNKWDAAVLSMSVAMSLVALGSLMTLTVLSGGSFIYIGAIIFTLAWLVVNLRGCYALYRRIRYPWEQAEVVTASHFHKLAQMEGSDEKIEAVLTKMPQWDQLNLRTLRHQEGSWVKAAAAWEREVERQKRAGYETLFNALETTRVNRVR